MSQHIVWQDEKKYVFGWDPPLASFFLQVHDLTKDEDTEDRIPVWMGTPNGYPEDIQLNEVAELVTAAQRYGLHIPHPIQGTLQTEKNWNR